MWDRVIGNTCPIDHMYTVIERCILKDVKQVVAGGNIMECEVLKDFARI